MNPGFHQAMMPNGAMMPTVQVMQQQQQQQQQQQPQSSPFNLNPQGIMTMYQSHQAQATGWKTEVSPQERYGYLTELYAPSRLPSRPPARAPTDRCSITALKLAQGSMGNNMADHNSWSRAISLEGNAYNKANNKVRSFLSVVPLI
jgi:hypothetical protein